MTQTNNEREAFEKWFEEWRLSTWKPLPNDARKECPKHWAMNAKHHMDIAWNARAKSPISQNEQQEAVAWMIWWDDDKWLFTGDREDFDTATKNKFPITPLFTSPHKQAIPEDVIKDAERYNWLKQNYHGFEMFRHSTIPYVTLDREVDKAMLNAAPTNTEVGE